MRAKAPSLKKENGLREQAEAAFSQSLHPRSRPATIKVRVNSHGTLILSNFFRWPNRWDRSAVRNPGHFVCWRGFFFLLVHARRQGCLRRLLSFDQGAISSVLRSSALQKLGLWSYSIYMIHSFVFQVMKRGASFIGQKAKLDLVGWHHDEKLMLLGTSGQALLPALILCVVLVVPVAALTYRWIEKPAMDAARRGLSTTHGAASGTPWLRAGSVRRLGFILRLRARSLVFSTRASIELGLDAVRAIARRSTPHIRT